MTNKMKESTVTTVASNLNSIPFNRIFVPETPKKENLMLGLMSNLYGVEST